MIERIDVTVTEHVLAQNDAKLERLNKTQHFEPTDRAPVVVDAQLWGVLKGRGGRFSEMLLGPREHLRGQLLNWKWRVETLRDDRPIETETLVVESDFGALRGSEFPLEIQWNADGPAKVIHLIKTPQDIDNLTIPDPQGGLNATRIAWYHAMREVAGDFDLRLNGQKVEIRVDLNHPGGPFPSAFALCGPNLFLWLKSDPERAHRLLEITTTSHLQVLACFAEITGRDPHHPVWLGADAAEMMRAEMFREFVVPGYLRIWEQHARPRTFHMCGKINHLLEILRDEMQIDALDGFGFPVDRERLGAVLGGQARLRGGPHPLLVHDGPPEAIIAAAGAYIRAVGQRGGYILSEGFGLMEGTPPQHIAALVEASRQQGWVGTAA